MKTIINHITEWMNSRSISDHQLAGQKILWRNEGYKELQNKLLFGRSNLFAQHIIMDTTLSQRYLLPLGTSDVRPPNGLKDFANLIKLEIAYDTDENGINMYYPASQIDLLEYSERELEKTPKISPRYFFDGMDSIIIYPKPTKPLMNGIRLHYNYYDVDLKETDDESKMNIPFYFIDLLFFYLDFCRKRYRSDITAAQLEYDLREKKLWEIVGVLNNRDVGPIEEEPIHLIGRFNG